MTFEKAIWWGRPGVVQRACIGARRAGRRIRGAAWAIPPRAAAPAFWKSSARISARRGRPGAAVVNSKREREMRCDGVAPNIFAGNGK